VPAVAVCLVCRGTGTFQEKSSFTSTIAKNNASEQFLLERDLCVTFSGIAQRAAGQDIEAPGLLENAGTGRIHAGGQLGGLRSAAADPSRIEGEPRVFAGLCPRGSGVLAGHVQSEGRAARVRQDEPSGLDRGQTRAALWLSES
jgi:hypothetical protein